MGKFRIEIEELAGRHFKIHYKSGDQAIIKKIDKILIELSEHPLTGVGNPEPLKHKLSGLWSRRLNQKHRLIYRVHEAVVTVFIISAMNHYGDK